MFYLEFFSLILKAELEKYNYLYSCNSIGEFVKIKHQLEYNLINSLYRQDINYDRGFLLLGLECRL